MAKKSSRGALKAQRDKDAKARREEKAPETSSSDKTEHQKLRVDELKKQLLLFEKELAVFIKFQTLNDVELIGSQESGHFKGHNSTELNASLNAKRQKVRKCKGAIGACLEKLYPGHKERELEKRTEREHEERKKVDLSNLAQLDLISRFARQTNVLQCEREEVLYAEPYMLPETTKAKLAVLSVALQETKIDCTVQECDRYIASDDHARFVGVEYVQRYVGGTTHDLFLPDSCTHLVGEHTSDGELDFQYVQCDCSKNEQTSFSSASPTVFVASPRIALAKANGKAVVSNLKVRAQRYQCELGVFSVQDLAGANSLLKGFANVFGVGFGQSVWGICGPQNLLDEEKEWQ